MYIDYESSEDNWVSVGPLPRLVFFVIHFCQGNLSWKRAASRHNVFVVHLVPTLQQLQIYIRGMILAISAGTHLHLPRAVNPSRSRLYSDAVAKKSQLSLKVPPRKVPDGRRETSPP